jgi:hypothetical protein
MLNERYVHHYFSHRIQEKYGLLCLDEKDAVLGLHPEWPTYKKATCLNYGRYHRKEGKYMPSESGGKGGWLDFAIGEYKRPLIAVEFSLKQSWGHEEAVFDYIKLLDARNPFNTSVSHNLIFRQRPMVRGASLKDLEEHMDRAYGEAVRRLGVNVCDSSRALCFIVTEVGKDDRRQHWHFDRTSRGFKEGLPQ